MIRKWFTLQPATSLTARVQVTSSDSAQQRASSQLKMGSCPFELGTCLFKIKRVLIEYRNEFCPTPEEMTLKAKIHVRKSKF